MMQVSRGCWIWRAPPVSMPTTRQPRSDDSSVCHGRGRLELTASPQLIERDGIMASSGAQRNLCKAGGKTCGPAMCTFDVHVRQYPNIPCLQPHICFIHGAAADLAFRVCMACNALLMRSSPATSFTQPLAFDFWLHAGVCL